MQQGRLGFGGIHVLQYRKYEGNGWWNTVSTSWLLWTARKMRQRPGTACPMSAENTTLIYFQWAQVSYMPIDLHSSYPLEPHTENNVALFRCHLLCASWVSREYLMKSQNLVFFWVTEQPKTIGRILVHIWNIKAPFVTFTHWFKHLQSTIRVSVGDKTKRNDSSEN